jgi:regulator of ribonuclease activity A
MTFSTTDLCDCYESEIHAGQIHVLPPVFAHYGSTVAFKGQAITLKVFEDNSLIKQILENEDGTGKVLVIDGGASIRCALVGGNLATAAVKNGWAGIVVDGAVRDVAEIEALAIGVRALALNPLRAVKRSTGVRDLTIVVAGVTVQPNDWIYADADGMLVSPKALV